MSKIRLFLTLLLLGTSAVLYGQTVQVAGTVTDALTGETVMGATIQVKGEATTYALTDELGRFTIRAPKNGVLIASFLGFKTQNVDVEGRTSIQIALEPDAEMLDDVLVVAFGTATKESFTGSASVLKSEDLAKHVTTNVANALVGSTPGLQLRGGSGAPGASQGSISIRGISSLYASTTPLIIVDGAPYSGSLSNIPQEDIESVTVLKDASSAALYGARGAAGVILVTTKTGKNKDAQISVDIKMGVNSRAVQDYETIMDPALYYETAYSQYHNYYFYGQGQSNEVANANANDIMIKHLGYNIYTLPENQPLLIGTDGRINPGAKLGRTYEANGEKYYLTNDNWRDAAYSNALRQEYNIGVNGAMDRGSYYASISYLNEDGIIEYSGYQRVAARLKADYQARKWLKIGANIGYTNSETESNPNLSTDWSSTNLMYYTSHIAPIYPIYVRTVDGAGNPVVRTDANGNPQYDYGVPATNFPGLSRAFLQTGNPFGSNRYNKVVSRGNKLSGTFNADVSITDYLKFNATSTIDWGHTNYSEFQNSLYGPKAGVNGEIYKSQSDGYRQNHVQTLKFYKQFGSHNIAVLAGHEYYKTNTTDLNATGQGLFTPEIQEINAAANNAVKSASSTSAYNVEGYFTNLQYNFQEKYYASASYRRDASSRFALENRWGDFWSVGGAWIVSKEDFFKVNWVDQLKLKASIGQQGNDNIGNWAYTDLYNLSSASSTKMSATFSRMGNKDITWETTTNTNIGLEFGLFGGRLNGTFDFYNKKTSDLLFWLSIPESAGSRGYYGNIGDIRNTGIELMLQGTIIRTKDVEWSVFGNVSHNKAIITKLPDSKVGELGGFTESSKWYKVGGPIYNPFRPEYAGVNEFGEALYYKDSDLKGATNRPGTKRDEVTTNPNEATKYELGDCLPAVFGGFGTTVNFYGFDLSVSFDYQIGGKVYDSNYANLMGNITDAGSAGSTFHVDILKSWTPDNVSSDIPRSWYADQYTTAGSDRWLTSASYLNFQSASIGYTLPKKLLSKLNIGKIRIYASGENLTFWSARKGLDPRYSFDGNSSVNVYSPVRTIMGGLQFTF